MKFHQNPSISIVVLTITINCVLIVCSF